MKLFLFTIVYFIQQSQEYQNTSACLDTYYFDTTSMNCAQCPTGTKRSSYSDMECICLPTYKKDANITGFKAATACTQCSSGAVSSDGYSCIPCPSGIAIDSTTGDCSCSTGSVIIDVDETGLQLAQKKCVTCATSAYPGAKIITILSSSSSTATKEGNISTSVVESSKFCKICPYGKAYNANGQCACDTTKNFVQAADTCVLQTDINTYLSGYDLDNIVKVNFQNILEGGAQQYESITSYTFRNNFYKFAVGCLKYSDMESCQGLANLCVLVLYDESSDICKLYKTKSLAAGTFFQQLDPGWYKNFPWLYFENDANAIRKYEPKMKVSFKETLDNNILHKLPFYLAIFTFEGKFLGIKPLENEFMLCPHSTQEYQEFIAFGKKYKNQCSFYLDSFINTTPFYFYELYLKDIDGTYISIPIKIQNFKNNLGVTVNTDSDTSKWRFVKRFTLYDAISGISQAGGNPEVYRYARLITLRMEFSDNSEKIYRPILIIEYAERRESGLKTTPQSYAKLETEYNQTFENFQNVTKILFIILNLVAFFIVIARIILHRKKIPGILSQNPEIEIIQQFFWVGLETWSLIMFAFCFAISGYWLKYSSILNKSQKRFAFYKLQKNVFTTVPLDQYHELRGMHRSFTIIFAILACFRGLTFMEWVNRQGKNIDLFFIDWEKDKSKMIIDNQIKGPNVWRSLFISNEFNELQAFRYLHSLDLEKLTKEVPYFSIEDDPLIQKHFIFKFFLSSTLLFLIGLTQIVVRKLVVIWFPTKVQEFIDLCSVSNISVFILDQPLHGYYIHGVAPGGVSEGTAGELRALLEAESRGSTRNRGLIPGDSTNLQTFEMYVTLAQRQEYQKMFNVPRESEIAEKINASRNIQVGGMPGSQMNIFWFMPQPIPQNLNFSWIEQLKINLTAFLKAYIEGVVSEQQKYIKEKTFLFRYFSSPPPEITDQANYPDYPFFYKDPNMSFQSIFFCGHEISILIVNVIIYLSWEFVTNNTTIAAILISYTFIKLFEWYRLWLGKRNISKKTLIDDRFLI